MEKKTVVVGMPLIAIAQGEDCGVVTQLVIDTAARRVTHLVMGSGKGLLGTNMAVPVAKIAGIGRDFITVRTTEDLLEIWKIGEGLGTCLCDGDLVGLTVVSSEGNIEGKVEDFAFDTATGALGEYYTGEGVVIASEAVASLTARGLFVNFNGEPADMGAAQPDAQPQVQSAPIAQPVQTTAPPVIQEPAPPVQPAAPPVQPAVPPAVKEPQPKEEPAAAKEKPAARKADGGDDYFVKKQSEYLLGRKAKKEIRGAEDKVLVAAGEKVTADVVEKVRAAGKLTELMLHVE